MHTSASSSSPSESGSSPSMGDWATPRRFGATLGGPPRRSPAMTSDALRTKRCARCDTAWATPVATAPRRRAGAAALAALEDGRALVARAACTELAARRSAAAAPGSWRLDVGPPSLCSSWSGWSGDPRQAAEEVSAPCVGAPLERFWPVAMPCARDPSGEMCAERALCSLVGNLSRGSTTGSQRNFRAPF